MPEESPMTNEGGMRLKVVVIGDSGVGKTSLVDMFRKGKVSMNEKPTVGADFFKMKVNLDGQQDQAVL